MTAVTEHPEAEKRPAPPRAAGRHVRRGLLLEIALVLALLLGAFGVLREQSLRQSFSVDESRWISTSRYFWITFVDGDVLGLAWQPNYLVLTHPPVARYWIGLGLWLQGWTPDELNGRYDTDRSRDYNRRAGNIPTADLLAAARRVVLVFALGAVLLLYLGGRSLGGPVTGTFAVVLALAHPLLSTLWTRALAESILAFFTLLVFVLAVYVASSIRSRRKQFALALGLGVAVGLAVATKLSGALVAAGLALFVILRQGVRWWQDRSWAGLSAWIDAGLAAVLTFVLVNPLLYPNPIFRTVMLFQHRREEMAQQALGTPRLAVPDDLGVRAELLYRRTFSDWGIFEQWIGVPLGGPLAAAGLVLVALITWRALRYRLDLGAPTLLFCWAVTTFALSTINLGFDSSHYIAPPATVSVLLQAVALGWAASMLLRVLAPRLRRAAHPTVAVD